MGIADSKVARLLSVLVSDPAEFLDRSRAIVDGRLSLLYFSKTRYTATDWKLVVPQLSNFLGHSIEATVREGDLADVASRLHRRMELLPAKAPFSAFHNGDLVLAEICYRIVRALRPRIVLETGVCYGVSSLYLLHALEANCYGELYSIDLPPLAKNGDDYIGWLVPEELRKRWTLQRGASRRLLVPLLNKVKKVDLFVHDSLHTYQNMKMELELVWAHMSHGGVVIADDIEGNAAFQEFAERHDVAFHAVVKEGDKNSLAGLLIKRA